MDEWSAERFRMVLFVIGVNFTMLLFRIRELRALTFLAHPRMRFDGNLPDCLPQEVCADVFNFTRDHGDGTGRRESRFIENCRCPSQPCGGTGTQLMFKETKTQAQVTCEDADEFPVCNETDIAKEQHNIGGHVFYRIRCVCPNNDFPGNFYNKMTVPYRRRYNDMTPRERMEARKTARNRYFRCRNENDRTFRLN